jgi:hypothetical protein
VHVPWSDGRCIFCRSAASTSVDHVAAACTRAVERCGRAGYSHRSSNGYRVSGGHRKTGESARAALDGLDIRPHLDAFDALRQLRNQSEYEVLFVQSEDVEQALQHSQAIVDAVADVLPR